jgi:hypothetical protein
VLGRDLLGAREPLCERVDGDRLQRHLPDARALGRQPLDLRAHGLDQFGVV